MDVKLFKQNQLAQAKIAHNNFILLQAPNYITNALTRWMDELMHDPDLELGEDIAVGESVKMGLTTVRTKN